MVDRIPWKGLERLGVFLVALHSFLIGVMLIFTTSWVLDFAGWSEVSHLFFPRQSGAFHIILAAGYWWEFQRHRTIGLMLMTLVLSVGLILLSRSGLPVTDVADRLVSSMDFKKVLMEGMLGLLLFAGALHVNLNDLSDKKLQIGVFATLGVLSSTFLVGFFFLKPPRSRIIKK